MGYIEELPNDSIEKLDLNQPTPQSNQQQYSTSASPDLIDQILISPTPFAAKMNDEKVESKAAQGGVGATAAMPPAMDSIRQYSADEVLSMLNRTPLFMTTLDETDGEGGENVELEALRQLAYEGTRAEVAQNFREQGNDHARAKNWREAKGYYDQALAALKNSNIKPQDAEEGEPEIEVVQVDEDEERKKEGVIEEACHINRALCNLELKNYRACTFDCASTIRLNPTNVKAYFRSASACLALDKIPEAEDACAIGLSVDMTNASLTALSNKIQKRKTHLEEQDRKRRERKQRVAAEKANLSQALKTRGIKSRTSTTKSPDTEDAIVKLEDPMDASSTLSVPVLLLYPLHAQSDFIKAFEEQQSLADHLEYILPLPWDSENQYVPASDVDCYIETTAPGGLIKVGKKLPLLKILGSGKVEIVDGLLKVYAVPRSKAVGWITDFKARTGRP